MRLADNLVNLGSALNIKLPRGQQVAIQLHLQYLHQKRKLQKSYQETRYNNTGHLPTSGEKQRCKMENCDRKTHVMCQKCNIHLCIVVYSKNCFAIFRTKK